MDLQVILIDFFMNEDLFVIIFELYFCPKRLIFSNFDFRHEDLTKNPYHCSY